MNQGLIVHILGLLLIKMFHIINSSSYHSAGITELKRTRINIILKNTYNTSKYSSMAQRLATSSSQ